ncbi:MAG: hypothetical protein CMO55_16140 [Verrucomicrobiales bacterium]|nr:hypothetical protein [Verrucomicrobiales bacterium]
MNPFSHIPTKRELAAEACGSNDHFSRRTLLQGIGLAGLSWLTPLSRQLTLAAETTGKRPKSVIVLWMRGGASQLETFDPHPGSPIGYDSTAIATATKGIQFGKGLEQTAELTNDFSIIRSVTSKEGDHERATYNVKTGYRPFPGLVHPSIGSVLCHELPAPLIDGSTIEIPTHISIMAGRDSARGGYLGAQYDAFQIGDPKSPIPDVRSRVDETRTAKRMDSLNILENSFSAGRLASLEKERTLHQSSIERARHMMSSDQLSAFEIADLPKAEREAYGDTPFGRGCLAAVRLVEAGVRCVEVTLGGWDTHANNLEGVLKQNAILDPALASLIKGLKARDLYDETIIVVGTEFGRTPKQNVTEGRDHWPHGFSILMGGGGLKNGQVIGETDPTGEKEEPAGKVRVEDIHATVLEKFGVDYEYELTTPIGRPLAISDGIPIRALL